LSSIEVTVDLDDFDDDDVIQKGLDLASDEKIIEAILERGFNVFEKGIQTDVDIVSQSLIDRFLEGFDKINRKDLEDFFNRQGV
jgi:hypothetical protein